MGDEDNKTNPEETNQSRKDISTKWLDDVIYNHLTNLNSYERLARDGCKNIIEYVNLSMNQLQKLLPDIQKKNLNLLISEFEMIFEDVKEVVEDKEMKLMIEKLKEIKRIKIIGIKGKPCFKIYVDRINKKNTLQLTSTFYILVEELSKLRGKLVASLKHILWVNDDGEFKKSKKKGEY